MGRSIWKVRNRFARMNSSDVFLRSHGDDRQLIADNNARYYGIQVNDQSLVPAGPSLIGPTRFDE